MCMRLQALLRCFGLVALLGSIASAQDFSANCKGPGESTTTIMDGKYKGTWKISVTFRQTVGGAELSQTITGDGEFTLKVDRGGSGGGSSLEGKMTTKTQASWNPLGATADQHLAGQADLALDGDIQPSEFRTKSSHSTSGSVHVTAMGKSASQGQSFSDTVDLVFLADRGDCDGASGHLTSESLQGMISSMEGAGYAVERPSWTWEMTREKEAGDPIQKFKDELEKKAPQGIVRTREVEARRLGKLAERIRNDEPESIRECLWSLWVAHVIGQYEAWAAEDAKSLTGYKGDWSGLQERIRRALDTDRALCLMGRDTCASSTHQQLWNAIQSALSAYLTRMAEGSASQAHLLDVLKSAQLLGAVSPALEEQTWAAIQAQAKEMADLTYANFLAAVQGARSAKRDPATDSTVQGAAQHAIAAEKAANLVGVEVHQSVGLAASLGLV
ncbi:MAG TPA: hypothetical protein VJ486_07255 [Geothrix sp.]|nr:hypothetical protein [Geothrix sp.]